MENASDNGRLADATGLSSATPIEPVPVSPVPASIPSAGEIMAALSFAEKMQIMAGKARLAERAYDWLSQFAWGAADHKSQVSFKPSFAGSVSGVAEAVKYVEQAITDSLPEILEKATRAAADDLSRLVAQAIETQSAKTEGLGPKDESAVAEPCAQGESA